MVSHNYKSSKENNDPEGNPPLIHYPNELLLAGETGKSLWPEVSNSLAELSLRQTIKESEEYKMRLDLLYQVGKNVGKAPHLIRLVQRITRMTQQALNASASSVLLLDEQEKELLFEVAEGEAGKRLRRVKLSARCGIAGWVARTGRPLIVDDVNIDPRFDKSVDEITGFTTKSIICVPLMMGRKIIGVIEVLNKVDGDKFNEQDMETLVSVSATAAMAIENVRLRHNILDAYKSTIKALAATVDAKDPNTRGHSQRVTEYTMLAANSLSLSEEDFEDLEYAGILHDIGKIGIPDRILAKPSHLTHEEQAIMHQHPQIGANMLQGIPFLEKARALVLHHHEKYDGTGYPDGLKGNAIPMGARVIAVADAFDTMTTNRPYRNPVSTEQAIKELTRFSGTQFCPVAVEAFITNFHEYYFSQSSKEEIIPSEIAHLEHTNLSSQR